MLTLHNVSKYYARDGNVALGLRKINLTVNRGEFIAVVGESGSGKSTLLNVISGLDTYEEGEMLINGEETSHYSPEDWEHYRRHDVGFVFQNYNLIESFTVLQNVESALILAGYEPEARRKRALELIDRVGLSGFKHTKASKLSGGQMQRTVIARALAKDSPIIAADEPTGNLDSATSRQIIELLAEVGKDKLVIVVTHEVAEVEHIATRKITVHDGQIVEDQQLRPPSASVRAEEPPEAARKSRPASRMPLRDRLLMASRHITATPFKSLMMFLVLLLLTLSSAFVYGAMLNMKDEMTLTDEHPYFPNSSEYRIVVNKPDHTAFTADELKQLGGLPEVREIVQADIALDQTMEAKLRLPFGSGTDNVPTKLMTRSVLQEGDLIAGRLPAADNEVVMNTRALRRGFERDDILNQTVEFQFGNSKYNLTVVGLSDNKKIGEMTYVDSKLLDSVAGIAMAPYKTVTAAIEGMDGIPVMVLPSEQNVQGDGISVNAALAQMYCARQPDTGAACADRLLFKNLTASAQGVYGTQDMTFPIASVGRSQTEEGPVIHMTAEQFESLMRDQAPGQISLILKSKEDSAALLHKLQERSYKAVYPFDTLVPPMRLVAVLQVAIITVFMLGCIAIIFFITYFIIRTIMKSKRQDYIILRSIGASRGFIFMNVFLELLIVGTAAYAAGWLISKMFRWLPEMYITRAISNLYNHYQWQDYIWMYALIAAIMLLLTSRMRKKLFKDSVMATFKGEEGAAA